MTFDEVRQFCDVHGEPLDFRPLEDRLPGKAEMAFLACLSLVRRVEGSWARVGATEYLDQQRSEDFPERHSVVKGIDKDGRHFVSFKTMDSQAGVHVFTVFRRHERNTGPWVVGGDCGSLAWASESSFGSFEGPLDEGAFRMLEMLIREGSVSFGTRDVGHGNTRVDMVKHESTSPAGPIWRIGRPIKHYVRGRLLKDVLDHNSPWK
jgi:hypothetical protein